MTPVLTPAQLRSSPRWKRVRKQVLREATVCELCWRPLDFEAPPRSRWSPSVDHIVPLSRGGDPFDLAGLRPAHYGCNASRQDGKRGESRGAGARLERARWF